MTEEEIRAAESQLGFKLPKCYTEPMLALGEELDSFGMNPDVEGGLCTTAEDLVGTQAAAVEAALCVNEEMVDWWAQYFAIAQDGGGGYYLLKRDGSPEVFLTDSDWYEEPRPVSPTFSTFLESVQSDEWPD